MFFMYSALGKRISFVLDFLRYLFQLIENTLFQQANRDWGECNSSVETGDSEECSSGSGTGEAPLYTASKVILLQHLAQVAGSLPRPHHTFTPGNS